MRRYFLPIGLGVLIAGFVLLTIGSNFYLDLLWFGNLDFEGVFWTQYLSRWGLRLFAWLFFLVFLFVNLMLTKKTVLYLPNLQIREELLSRGYYRFVTSRRITVIFLLVSAVVSFLFSSYAGGYWMEMQQFVNSTSFGIIDPIFNSDASYYIFQLPFLRFLYQYLMMVVVVTLLLVGAIHLILNPPNQVDRKWFHMAFPGLGHLSFLFAAVFFLKAWDYRMQMLELLQSPRGYSFGAGFTDIAVNYRVLWILLVVALIIGVFCLINMYRRRMTVLVYGLGALLAVSLLGGSLLPSLVQQFLVSPSELSYEMPYIEHNIEYTRKAYGLDQFETREHQASPDLYVEDVEEVPGTLNNIRLWDYRPIRDTFTERQAIRPYYAFPSVDIDRYTVDGDYRQVMLAPREMNQDALDERAQTWTNQRLQFTHGYGVVMSPVNEATPDGLPTYFLQDIPPQGKEELNLEKPELYYGEMKDNYVIANTDLKEFNYPEGDTNVYKHYQGEGGIELNSWARRAMFALRFADYRVLFSGEINPESRFMFNRQIQDRVQKAAPFLNYDEDPYIVVNDGKLYWIQDAYTVTRSYPYSEPHIEGGINYIRNSVKVVVDAYDGSMDFFVVEPDDPMIQTYQKIFPDLFSDMEEMPEGLREHIRYPEGLFSLQADKYREYHVTDPVVFYNREDLWELPQEKYRGQEQPVEPYYLVMELPEEEGEEFVMINPFTPRERRNMISWMAARCDYENYGEVIVYQFPKDRVITGPMQIENLVDQDTEISEQIALWDQQGSRVIRGNLLAIPVQESVLYVEPLFLQAEDEGIPELSRVVVAFGESVVMERTLEEALVNLLGERVDVPGTPEDDEVPEEVVEEELEEELEELEELQAVPGEVQELVDEMGSLFQDAQQSIQEGDWATYGEKLNQMEEVMEELEGEVN